MQSKNNLLHEIISRNPLMKILFILYTINDVFPYSDSEVALLKGEAKSRN